MVVVPEPSVKCFGALGAVAVDRAVVPASDEGADESFGFAVGLRASGSHAEMFDAQGAARDRVHRRDVGATVVCHHGLDGDPVPLVEADRSAQEADRGGAFLVSEDLGIREAGGVVDRDVNVLPAGCASYHAPGVRASWWRARLPVMRCPAPSTIRPSFLTSM